MASSMTVKFTLNRKEVCSSLRQSMVRQRAIQIIVALLVVLAAVPVIKFFQHAEDPRVPFQPALFVQTALALLALPYLFGLLPVLLSRKMNPALLDKEQVLRFDDEGLTAVTGAGESKVGWKSWAGYRETPGFFLLQFGPRAFQPLPKRAFATPQEVVDFRNLLKQKVRR
jgi:hypothetical protein